MSNSISVQKRDGTKEPLDLNKIHKVVEYACDGISGVSVSELELKSQLMFFDGITTKQIQQTLIRGAVELISEDSPNYQVVASKLINYDLRKEVYNDVVPARLYDHVLYVTGQGFYTDDLLKWYTEEEFDKMDVFIDHDRDYDMMYAGIEQFREKYIVKNKVTGKIYETPQMAYALIAATLFHDYPPSSRLKWIREYYDMASQFYISLPTPIMAGVRTNRKQFSSCTLINCGDSRKSINATAAAIIDYVSDKAGIGVNVGRIRAKGSPVRNGDTFHTGIIPFLKHFQTATKSCNQGGVRNGSATFNYPIWHLEFKDLIVIKNNKGTEETRIRDIDWCVQLCGLFYQRLIDNKDITFFCPNDVPQLYEAFFKDQKLFEKLYKEAEKNPNIRKEKMKAMEVFSILMQERVDTGRIYIMHVDHCNEHGSFISETHPIYQTNLCCEVTLSNTSMGHDDEEIALCTLSSINWGKINSPEDFERSCAISVRALDALLDYQHYPVEAARVNTMKFRPLGIGITGLAHFMAKKGLTYEGNQETFDTINEYAEAWSYYLIRASVDLAKERGKIKTETKYSKGILPVDTYKTTVDEISNIKQFMPWQDLREDLKKYGIRNATLMAVAPVETSSQLLNSTNGIEPPQGLISFKQSKNGSLKQIVPGYPRLKNKYQLLWDLKTPQGYLKIAAIITKYLDQSISTNTSYNPKHYPNEKLSIGVLLQDLLDCYKYGIKTLYYNKINDGAGDASLKNKEDEPAKSSNNNDEMGCGPDGACIL